MQVVYKKEDSENTSQKVVPSGNVIIGENAIVYLFHRKDKQENTVLEEVLEHRHFVGEYLNVFKRSAEHTIMACGWSRHPDHKKGGQGRKGIQSWGKHKKGGPRVYLRFSDFQGKPVYIILLVGDKNTQDNDGDYIKAENRWNKLIELMDKGIINLEQEILDAMPKTEPKVISHHRQGKNRSEKAYQRAE